MKTNWRIIVTSLPAILISVVFSFGFLRNLFDFISFPFLSHGHTYYLLLLLSALAAIGAWVGVAWTLKAEKLTSTATRSGITFVLCFFAYFLLATISLSIIGE